MCTLARVAKFFDATQLSQSVDTKRTPLSLHYLILMCHLKKHQTKFRYGKCCGSRIPLRVQTRRPEISSPPARDCEMKSKRDHFGGQTVSVKAAAGNSDRLTFTPSDRESTSLLMHIFAGFKHFLFTHVPSDNQSVGDE